MLVAAAPILSASATCVRPNSLLQLADAFSQRFSVRRPSPTPAALGFFWKRVRRAETRLRV